MYSVTSLSRGIIEDVNINRIKTSKCAYRLAEKGSQLIDGLARSIKEKGLLQPIIVRIGEDEFYEIIGGNRRYLACRKLGLRKIPCLIVKLNDQESFEVSLVENIQRKTLLPVEEAMGFKEYIIDFGWGGISDLSRKISKSKSYIDKRLRLLNLHPDIIEKISLSILKPSVAEELLPIHDINIQNRLANEIIKKNMSSRKIRQLVKDHKDYTSNEYYDSLKEHVPIERRDPSALCFDKSIIVLKIAIDKIGAIMEDAEHNWIVYETLLHHRKVLHSQIDLLIREKKKIRYDLHNVSAPKQYH